MTAGALLDQLANDPDYQRRGASAEAARAAIRAVDEPERQRVVAALEEAGIDSTDFGRFVNNTKFFRPSAFDQRAAIPVLLAVLPGLSRPRVVATVAGHLMPRAPTAIAYPVLLEAFRRWGPDDDVEAGWVLGDALARSADVSRRDDLLEIAETSTYGRSRARVVGALWRFRKNPRVADALEGLVSDPHVALEAMSALRQTVGNEAALPHLRRIRDDHQDPVVRKNAERQVARAEKAANG